MTKTEFLEELRRALGNDLTGSIVNEHVNYYAQYIADEINSGKSETEVVDDLGDPWAIARNIINGITHHTGIEEQGSGYSNYGGSYEEGNYRTSDSNGEYSSYEDEQPGFMDTVKKYAMYALIAIIIIAIVVIFFGVVGVALRFLFPVLLVYGVFVLIRSLFMRR